MEEEPVPEEQEMVAESTMPAVVDQVEYKLVKSSPVRRGLFGRRK